MQALVAISLVLFAICPQLAAVVIVGGVGVAIIKATSQHE
jgi:flagellar biosynthesis protein FliQ